MHTHTINNLEKTQSNVLQPFKTLTTTTTTSLPVYLLESTSSIETNHLFFFPPELLALILLFWSQRGNQKTSSHQRLKSLPDSIPLSYQSLEKQERWGGEKLGKEEGKGFYVICFHMAPSLPLLDTRRGKEMPGWSSTGQGLKRDLN